MTIHRCAILFPSGRGHMPGDEHGCLLPNGHHEPHEFIADNGHRIAWETDMDCDCEDCQSDEPDNWCIVYKVLNTLPGEDHE
jgi:hypothetical protein